MAVELAPDSHKHHGRALAVAATTIALFGTVLGLVVTFRPEDLWPHLALLGVGLVVWGLFALSLRSRFRHISPGMKLAGLDLLLKDRTILADYASSALSLLLLLGLLVVALSPISIPAALVLPPVIISIVLVLSRRVYARTVGPPSHMSAQEMLEQQARVSGKLVKSKGRDRKW
jgi:membrane protein implicated in regulation of membrane protease activity